MRLKRDLSSGAWAMLGWYALMRSGEWLMTQVVTHVKAETAMWYEVIIVLLGMGMAIGAVVGDFATLLGAFDK